MGLEEVKAELLGNMQTELDRISKESEIQKKELDAQLKAEMKQRRKAAEEAFQRELERLSQIRESEAKSEASHLLLERKRKLIADSVKKAKHELGADTLKALLKKAQEEIDVARVLCRKQDIKLLGPKAVPADITGGLIAENEDGTVSLNYTYDEILARAAERHLREIAAALFH